MGGSARHAAGRPAPRAGGAHAGLRTGRVAAWSYQTLEARALETIVIVGLPIRRFDGCAMLRRAAWPPVGPRRRCALAMPRAADPLSQTSGATDAASITRTALPLLARDACGLRRADLVGEHTRRSPSRSATPGACRRRAIVVTRSRSDLSHLFARRGATTGRVSWPWTRRRRCLMCGSSRAGPRMRGVRVP